MKAYNIATDKIYTLLESTPEFIPYQLKTNGDVWVVDAIAVPGGEFDVQKHSEQLYWREMPKG